MEQREIIWEGEYYRLTIDNMDDAIGDVRIETKVTGRLSPQPWRGLMASEMTAEELSEHGEETLELVKDLDTRRSDGWLVTELNPDDWTVVLVSPTGIRCMTAPGEYFVGDINNVEQFIVDLQLLTMETEPFDEQITISDMTRQLQRVAQTVNHLPFR